MSGIWLLIAAFSISLFLLIIYFSKSNINNSETKLYGKILVLNSCYSLVALFGYFFAKTVGIEAVIMWIQKTHLILTFLISFEFFHYNLILLNLDKKNIRIFSIIYKVLFIIGVLLAPVEVINYDDVLDVGGLAYEIAIIGVVIDYLLIVISTIAILVRHKSTMKKSFPLIVLIVLLAFGLLLRAYFPEIITETYCVAFVLLIMYFTIENPDVKMITQLEIAKNAAEKANRAKSDFLSSMSHEIRTPLNAIVGLSQDIVNYDIPKEALEDANDIINASNTLLEIVGNILDINKIESAKMEIVEQPYNFRNEIESLIKVTSTRIGEKPIEFSYSIAEDIPEYLIGDKVHMKAIVNNLVTNAIKYTDKGKINVSIKCINREDICNLFISVQDTGRGIKSDDINKLFTKFERLDIEKNSTTEGTGLGLAITKRLTEMMGGKINVQSTYGIGSLFVVSIPQKISKREDLTNTQVIRTQNILSSLRNDYKGKKILIVDDNKLNIKVARRALNDFEFSIDEAYNGEECLNLIRSGNSYDLILMDIMMPVMSGTTALNELKKIEGFNTPVIALTADAISGSEEKYKSEGFVCYIAKPFSKEQIQEKLDTVFMGRNN